MRRNWTRRQQFTVPGVRAASNASAFAPNMPVYRIRNSWRARRKMSGKTFCGPIRDTEKAANEDAQQLEEAAAVCIERLKEVHARLQHGAGRVLPAPSVVQHGSSWQVRVTIGKKKVSGPTRQSKTEAEKDCLRLTESEHRNTAELQSAVCGVRD